MGSAIAMVVFLLCLVTLCSPGHAVSETGNPDLDRAYKLHCDGELQEAIDVYSKVAATDTDTSHIRQAMFATAACYFDLRDYDAAVAAFLDFARTYSDDKQAPLALVYAGNCRMDQKQFAEAQPLYEEALTTESNGRDAIVWLPWANLGMGRLLTKLGRYNDAIPFLDKAIEHAREPKMKVEASLFKSHTAAMSKASGQRQGMASGPRPRCAWTTISRPACCIWPATAR